MAKDDLVDFVDDLPSNLITKVLKATSPEDKQLVTSYLNFKDDSAGTLRTPEYLELKASDTIGHAIKKIREEGGRDLRQSVCGRKRHQSRLGPDQSHTAHKVGERV